MEDQIPKDSKERGVLTIRIRWRTIGFFFLGLLLVGVIAEIAVPYLHHLASPDALPINAFRRVTGYPIIPLQAVIPEDRQIDELGVPGHIRTEADAGTYVQALMNRWDPRETNPHLAEFEERLARAEYAAVRDPKKLIPESQVAKTFNHLMDEWNMPGWTRISVPELHFFRIVYSSAIYPRSVTRLPDGSVAPGCRPTETLLLLDWLDFTGGAPPNIRKAVRDTRFPWVLLKRLEWSRPPERPVESAMSLGQQSTYGPCPEYTQTPEDRQVDRYSDLRRKYFARHPEITFESVAREIFSELGIH
jgi:hypothetical protein